MLSQLAFAWRRAPFHRGDERWSLFELKTGEPNWSKEVFCILEIDESQFRPTYEAFLNLVHPDDRGLLDDTYKNSVRTKTS